MKTDNPAKRTDDKLKEEALKGFKEKVEEIKPTKTQHLSEFDNKWNMNNKIIELFAKNIEKDQQLKEKYAIILIIILAVQLIALIAIFTLKGCNVLNYSDTTFNIFITGGIAEVFILVRVIVKYLFKDNLTNALNIILENNNKTRYKKQKYKTKISDKPRKI